MFTVWLASHGVTALKKPGGTITYGGVDDDNCGAVIGYTNLTDPQFYQFKPWEVAIYQALYPYCTFSDGIPYTRSLSNSRDIKPSEGLQPGTKQPHLHT
ncbi:unnamed protein product [Haemonchus placei]|uniref:Phytocyanin domain-containing protein n=1 Tax=Haemonchus placei TaxID=6290 RepID=A0A0N4W1R2_HAEPC|nr:unnamed protein product [Haemonchus placei]